jgi:uncharacterized protein RhaS with RHS repeats
MYDPAIGRFLTEDPIGFEGDPSNLYRYVKNNPLSFTDPSGLVAVKGNEWGDWEFEQKNTDLGASADPKLKPTFFSDIKLTFKPAGKCAADEIAFVQIARIVGINGHKFVDDRANIINRTTKDGWAVDRPRGNDSAWFSLRNDGTWLNVVPGGTGKDAILRDRPRGNEVNTRWEFETYAICKKGKDAGKVYAGFSWGFEVDGGGKVTSLMFSHLDKPSQNFLDSISAWNTQAKGPAGDRNNPNQQVLDYLK